MNVWFSEWETRWKTRTVILHPKYFYKSSLPPSLPPSLPLSLSPSLSPFLPSFLLSIPVLGLFHTTEVQLIYNAVLVLGVQQSDSVYIYTELLFRFFFIIGYYNKSNIVPCVIQ